MNISNLETLTQKGAIFSINAYKKHISPRKGFSCPHRLLHGGPSCSDYVKELFLHQDLVKVMGMTKQRFENCAKASQELQNLKSSSGCIIIPCCFPI
jgi:putative component of membrane protein insertase Oxa1/YidC/SpoIIIJ protein YidD